MVYYNENDPCTAAWLERLVDEGHIAHGVVDTRSIQEVDADDLEGFTQCHFFAGIGGWSYALRLAGWPDDRPAWTGSCPCQPFSAAGRQKGFADERHLWPYWFPLIQQCHPAVVFGEQVASPAGLGWLDLVCADMEGEDYALGAADLCAAGVGAPHIRQRLFFVADSNCSRRRKGRASQTCTRQDQARIESAGFRDVGKLANPEGQTGKIPVLTGSPRSSISESRRAGRVGRLGNSIRAGLEKQYGKPSPSCETPSTDERQTTQRADAPVDWRSCDWLPCRDGKARAVEPGTFPLAHGVPSRVGRLRGYGNAIVPQVAAEFIKA